LSPGGRKMRKRLESLIGQEVTICIPSEGFRKERVILSGFYLNSRYELNVAYSRGLFLKTLHFSNCQEVYDLYMEDSEEFNKSLGVDY